MTERTFDVAGRNRKARPGEYREESLDEGFVQQAHKDAAAVARKVSAAA